MRIIETLPIGTEVWYFNPVLDGDIDIIKGIVMGCFINKNEGELYYQLINMQTPAWCVSDTKEGIEILRRAFLNYREKLIEANKENKKRYNVIREGALFDEYKVDNLPKEEKEEKDE